MKTFLIAPLLLWAAALPLQPAVAAEGRVYTPGPFDGITIDGSAEVRFTQGNVDQVFVEGDEQMQRGVTVEVRGGMLRVNSSGSWKFWSNQRLHLQVTARQLARLTISGAADVHAPGPLQGERLRVSISGAGLARFDQLDVEQLVFSVSGAGDGQMAGRVGELNLTVSGKSDFQGENLRAGKARVSISGIGDAKVWATEELSIGVAGIGKVEYWGTPRVRPSTSGMATINARGPKPPLAPVAPVSPLAPAAPVAPAADARPAAAPSPTAEPRPANR